MEVLLVLIVKFVFIIKIIAFSFFFFFVSKKITYNDWFHEHYTDISCYTVGGLVAVVTPLQIHSQLGLMSISLAELVVKTIVAVTITFFLNKALKKYTTKTENEDIDKMDKKP